MDIVSIVYSFIMMTGTGKFVINDATTIAPHVVEVDVETFGLHEDQRYILLIDHGAVMQHVRVPLSKTECANPH